MARTRFSAPSTRRNMSIAAARARICSNSSKPSITWSRSSTKRMSANGRSPWLSSTRTWIADVFILSRACSFSDPQGSGLAFQASLAEGANGLDRVGLLGPFVRAVALDAGKSQGEPAGVMGARLDIVERDLDHKLRLDIDRVGVAGDGELAQLSGLPRQHLVRHALEGLPQHHKRARVRVSRAEVQIAEPAGAPAMAPFGSEHHQIKRDRGLDLEPGAAACTRLIGRVQSFCHHPLMAGREGVMAKALDAPYEAGARGGTWLKIKPAVTLDLVVLAAEWGHGRRTGWLSNLHLGARDPDTGGFVMLGKTFKGMTDEILEWQTAELRKLAIAGDTYTVYVEPKLVVEIAFNDIQASPHYPGGLALRFARVKRYRPDKRAEEADTIETVRALCERRLKNEA